MSTTTKYEILEAMRPKYKSASKSLKKQILDEYCSLTDCNRKHAIRLFNSSKPVESINNNLSKRGRKKIYDHPHILTVLMDIWVMGNLPCSKRLKVMIPLWLPFYDSIELSEDVKEKLLSISPSTIDRLMLKKKNKFNKKGLSTTKPGSIIKKHIPVKTNQWDEKMPGFIEADTVAHCGNSTAGMYVFTVNCVDIATQWTEQRAVWGKGEKGVLNAIKDIESHLPFQIQGFDCDNGSEFLNWHLFRFFTERKKAVKFTRSRAYHKNDNAHIENKNWTHVRQYLGFQRFENPELVDMLNNLFTSIWNDYFNFFNPSVKLIEKRRVGSKTKKIHDNPKTPFQRIMESPYVDEDTKQMLDTKFKSFNPIKISKQLNAKIREIIDIVNK